MLLDSSFVNNFAAGLIFVFDIVTNRCPYSGVKIIIGNFRNWAKGLRGFLFTFSLTLRSLARRKFSMLFQFRLPECFGTKGGDSRLVWYWVADFLPGSGAEVA